jgi:tRNA dimethylallyltransferase
VPVVKMDKLLVICGPTATGKTSLALSLAKKFGGELISADSRQVYKGMDIGTGKDLNQDSKFQTVRYKSGIRNLNFGFYTVKGVHVWGYDLVYPKDDFNVVQYLVIAKKVIRDIWGRSKLPILVGGTGLYIKAVIDGIETAGIAPDRVLRRSLSGKTPNELFEILAVADPLKAASMNISDKRNPRRLIRAIEIVNKKTEEKVRVRETNIKDFLYIGLIAQKYILFKKIEDRVYQRLKRGFEEETLELLDNGLDWNDQSMQSLGYRQYRDYYEKKVTKEEFIKDWISEEKKYAKRQITWFKKDKRMKRFDISYKEWKGEVEKLVKNWYIRSNDKKS